MPWPPDESECELVRHHRDLNCGDILVGVRHFNVSFWDFPLTFVRSEPTKDGINSARIWLAGDKDMHGEVLQWYFRKSWVGVYRLK